MVVGTGTVDHTERILTTRAIIYRVSIKAYLLSCRIFEIEVSTKMSQSSYGVSLEELLALTRKVVATIGRAWLARC